MHFADRSDAGRALALLLRDQQPSLDAACVVLGLARGGVPVAAEVATGLGAALDYVEAVGRNHSNLPWQRLFA